MLGFLRSLGRTNVSNLNWFNKDELRLDNVLPLGAIEFENQRYAANSVTKTQADMFTFTRASTATYIDSSGVVQTALADELRFTHDPYTLEPLGALIEDSSTNLLLRTTEFEANSWIYSNMSVVTNVSEAPDGTLSMDKLVPNNTNNIHFMLQNITTVSGNSYTFSMYVKPNGYDYIQITGSTGFSTDYMNFYLSGDGSIGNTNGGTGTIKKVGTDCYRISYTLISNTNGTGSRMLIAPLDADTAARLPTWTPDGTSGIDAWGAQFEKKLGATSYIPTYGSTVTRALDDLTLNSSLFPAIWNQSEGTVIINYQINFDSSNAGLFQANSSTIDDVIDLIQSTNINRMLITSNGVGQLDQTNSNITFNTDTKVALAYAENNSTITVNGVAGSVDNSCIMPTTINGINVFYDGLSRSTGTIKSIYIYPNRGQQSELTRITT